VVNGEQVRFGTAKGRWVLAVTVLGSGVAFLDGTVVNVALPAIARDFHVGLSSLQWIVDAYLLSLGSMIILAGSLGDIYGRRRIFTIGLGVFVAASMACGFATNVTFLIVARLVQGLGGALLVPGSLAILSSSFHPDDRSRAIGAWSGLGGAWTAIGPFLGGWLVDNVSWRYVFFINLPIVTFTVAMALRQVPETMDEKAERQVDMPGAVAVSLGLAGLVYALIEGPAHGFGSRTISAALIGVLGLALFPLIELRSHNPLVPLEILRSRQFTGANMATIAVYGALGTAIFLFVVHLQQHLGYTALTSGIAFLPATFVMILVSSRAGQLAQRVGPRLPMTVGPLVAGLGLFLLGLVHSGSSYVTGILPGVLLLGLGLAITVAPLTSAVLAAVEDRHMGVGSAINNAVARIASLLAVATLPAIAGLSTASSAAQFQVGYTKALVVAALLCVLGGLISYLTIRRSTPVESPPHVHVTQACNDPALRRAPRPAS
jgi:EmrB/QacA subfamily drug resistance transporter